MVFASDHSRLGHRMNWKTLQCLVYAALYLPPYLQKSSFLVAASPSLVCPDPPRNAATGAA